MDSNRYSLISNYPYLYQLANAIGLYRNTYHQPINFYSGLSDVRNRLYDDITFGSQNMMRMFRQPMSNINSTEIGDRLGRRDIRPSSTTGSSL